MAVDVATLLVKGSVLTGLILILGILGRLACRAYHDYRLSKLHGGFHAPELPTGPLLPIRGRQFLHTYMHTYMYMYISYHAF
jgi:hypothetical protein